jgi:hypothetical protein
MSSVARTSARTTTAIVSPAAVDVNADYPDDRAGELASFVGQLPPRPADGADESRRKQRVGVPVESTELTWREKAAIIDTTARIAVGMFLAIVLFCELLLVASS